jgi:hypothetical protein
MTKIRPDALAHQSIPIADPSAARCDGTIAPVLRLQPGALIACETISQREARE